MKNAKKGQFTQAKALLAGAKKGDFHSLAKLLSSAEADLLGILQFLATQKKSDKAIRLGITGPPGAGKSTLVNLVISHLRKMNLKVGVLAIDPSSPFSGGALLGDRVRMSEHAGDKNVFIRSLGSRGGFGGLSAATGVMSRIFEICGFDIIIIETVGVGQTELEVMNLVDATTVVLVPESGDVIQTLKAGILEIADLFVVNKSDRPGADILASELKSLCEQEQVVRPVFMTSAINKTGVSDWVSGALSLAKEKNKSEGQIKKQTLLKGELRSLVLFELSKKLNLDLSKIKKVTHKNYFSEAVRLLKKYN